MKQLVLVTGASVQLGEAMTAQLDSWTVAAKTLIRLTHEHAA